MPTFGDFPSRPPRGPEGQSRRDATRPICSALVYLYEVMKTAAQPHKAKLIRISAIRLDFQPSENLLEDKVVEFVDRLRRRELAPPVTVRFDGTNHFLEDGFHSLEATRQINRKWI